MTKIIGLYPVKHLVNLNTGDMFILIDCACISTEVFVKGPDTANGSIECVRIFSEKDYERNYAKWFSRDTKVSLVRIDGNFVVEE